MIKIKVYLFKFICANETPIQDYVYRIDLRRTNKNLIHDEKCSGS